MNYRIVSAILYFAILAAIGVGQTRLQPQAVKLKNGETFKLNIPAGYEIIPAAEGLKRVRFFAKAPDGRLFVTDMYNLTDNKRGAIYILDGCLNETTWHPCGFTPLITCSIAPSLPAASIA